MNKTNFEHAITLFNIMLTIIKKISAVLYRVISEMFTSDLHGSTTEFCVHVFFNISSS